MRNNNSKVLIIAFYAIIIIPTLIYPFLKDKLDTTNYENRVLYSLKDFDGINLSEFPNVFDNFLNDNIPFKNELQKIKSLIKYYIFKTPFAENVIIGKDGWMFFNSGVDGVTDTVGDYRGVSTLTEKEENTIFENLNLVNSKINNDGANFHLMIPNSKSIIYREYFDKNYGIKTKKTRVDVLIDKIQSQNLVDIIYSKDDLLKYKDKYRLYYKHDTHWNQLGGTIGVFSIVKKLENIEMNLDNYSIQYNNESLEDLAIMNHLKFNEKVDPIIIDYNTGSSAICTGSLEDTYECENSAALYDRTVMLIGDSFRISMVDSLTKTYSRVIIVYVPTFKYSLISEYKPQDVIYEVVERNIYQLYRSFGIPVITDTFEISK